MRVVRGVGRVLFLLIAIFISVAVSPVVGAVAAQSPDGAAWPSCAAELAWARDYSEQQWVGSARANVLTLNSGSPWLREYPMLPGERSAAEVAAASDNSIVVRELDAGTVLVRVPSFDAPHAPVDGG